MTSEMTKYVLRIRNPRKQNYAGRYALWLIGGQRGTEPTYDNLSFMAAQEVRYYLHQLFEQWKLLQPPLKEGDRVACNHQEGCIASIRNGIAEVRLNRGIVAVDVSELIAI